jgi:hypothetical protein
MKQDRPRSPKKTAVIDLRLSDELKDAFVAQCHEDNETVSGVLRGFITAHLRAREKQKAAQRLRRRLLTMIESLRMIVTSSATGGGAVAAALILTPVALEVLPVAPADPLIVSAEAPSEGATVTVFEVDPVAPSTGPEVSEMAEGQDAGPVSLATQVAASL